MNWGEVSKHMPGRSAMSCRLRYRNYVKSRHGWSQERKDKLVQLYEEFKPEMWSKVAEELKTTSRAAEAMYMSLADTDIKRRQSLPRHNHIPQRHSTVPPKVAASYRYGLQPPGGRSRAGSLRRETMLPRSARSESVQSPFASPLPVLVLQK